MYVRAWQQGTVEAGCLCFRQFAYCIHTVNTNTDDIGCFKALTFGCTYAAKYGAVVHTDDQPMFNFRMLNQH
ncbi:Uncharacterised protein [Shigella flexneri]|nr:Uncharacterised protein [Shigella flexneri]